MEEKDLISKIQLLKQVKPRKEWVFSVKNEILSSDLNNKVINSPEYGWTFSSIFNSVFQRKFSYAFALLLIVFISFGAIEMMGLPGSVENNSSHTSAVLSERDVKSKMDLLEKKSQALAQISSKNSAENDVEPRVQELNGIVNNIAESIQGNPNLAKTVAGSINDSKTYLDVISSDNLKETSGLLYKTIVEEMITYLDTVTLTETQQKELTSIKTFYAQGNYNVALENILKSF